MKFSELKQIIDKEAQELRQNSINNGSFNDGTAKTLLKDFLTFKENFLNKGGLNPITDNVESIEIGEPQQFQSIIDKHRV